MKEFARLLILLVIILPLGLLFIGPLLIMAALRGVQYVGPIVLNPGRRGAAARGGALLLGIAAWLAIWGGLALLLTQSGLFAASGVPSPGRVAAVTLSPTRIIPTWTVTLSPSSTASSTATPVPSPSPTPSPLPPTGTPTPPAPTPTPVLFTPTALPSATFTPGPAPRPTLAPELASEAIAAVETANELLRQAAMEPSMGNLAALEAVWQGRALARAQAFAQDVYQAYRGPVEISLVYLALPIALGGDSLDTAIVTSTEAWTYTASLSSHSEAFDFSYNLVRRDGSWAITNYTYRNAPNALPTSPVKVTGVLTATNALTSTTPITSQP